MTRAEPLVLHVIPSPAPRGAQREARALADRLDAPSVRRHRLLSLCAQPSGVTPDLTLGRARAPGGAAGFDPRLLARLRREIRRLGPVAVVAHGGEALKPLVPAMAGSGTPLAYYAIGTYAGSADRRLQLALWRRLAGRAQVVCAEGDEVRDECARLLKVPDHRLVMMPNGRDPEVFRPSAGRRPVPVAVFVGALTTGKGPDRFVDVVRALRAEGAVLRALLAGDGPLRGALAATAAAAGVEMLGAVSDVPALLRRADVLVFPSRPSGEGMPGVLIEAGMSGVPVVATAVPGAGSIVDDGETGTLVPVDDPASLAAATARLLGSGELRDRMGAAARRRCVERFSLDHVADRWRAALGPLLER